MDRLRLISSKLSEYSIQELGAEFHFHALEALEKFDAPEAHLDVIFRCECAYSLWILEVNLDYDVTSVVFEHVPVESNNI